MGKDELRDYLMGLTVEELNSVEQAARAILLRKEKNKPAPRIIPDGETA